MITPIARLDFARQIYDRAISCEECAGLDVSPKDASWFQHIRVAIRHTPLLNVDKDAWFTSIEKALVFAGVEWTPGTHRAKITSRRIVNLLGSLEAEYASPFRDNVAGNELEGAANIQGASISAAGLRRIDFGCIVPTVYKGTRYGAIWVRGTSQAAEARGSCAPALQPSLTMLRSLCR